jgi:transposase
LEVAMANRSEWDERLKRWANSGRSIEAFAAREGIDPKRLKWWRWKLRPSSPPVSAPAVPGPRFVPVHVVDSPAGRADGGAPLEIVLPNGRVVRVPPSFDAAALERVLAIASREETC